MKARKHFLKPKTEEKKIEETPVEELQENKVVEEVKTEPQLPTERLYKVTKEADGTLRCVTTSAASIPGQVNYSRKDNSAFVCVSAIDEKSALKAAKVCFRTMKMR